LTNPTQTQKTQTDLTGPPKTPNTNFKISRKIFKNQPTETRENPKLSNSTTQKTPENFKKIIGETDKTKKT
jgi:hypothetical protein